MVLVKYQPIKIKLVQSFTIQWQWPHGNHNYIKHGTVGIMKVVQLGAGKFNTNSCVCIRLYQG